MTDAPVDTSDDVDWASGESGTRSSRKPVYRRRSTWIAFGVVALIVAIVGVVAISAVPFSLVQSSTVVADPAVSMTGGTTGATFFPFAATPSGGVSGTDRSNIVNTSVNGRISLVDCQPAAVCAGVTVLIIPASEQTLFAHTGSAPDVLWCSGAAGVCGPVHQVEFNVDVSAYSNQLVELVVIAPNGVSNATVSAFVNMYWTG